MRVGINMPWYDTNKSGQDIGPNLTAMYPAPPDRSTNDPKKAWMLPSSSSSYKTVLDQQLSAWKSYGIECVRWFLLTDGVTLPPPTYDPNVKQWTVPSSQPAISEHVSDFTALLDIFVRQKMKIIPSFVNYEIFYPLVVILANSGAPKGQGGDVAVPAPDTAPGQAGKHVL